MRNQSIVFLLLVLSAVMSFQTPLSAQGLPYLGQTPPGRQLTRFAPDIVPADLHCTVTVSPDGQEIYWTNNVSIFMTKIEEGHWTTPEIVSFSGDGTTFGYDDNPVVSPDNERLFFTSFRPIGYASGNIEHIWVVERTPAGWSEPQPLPPVINTTPHIHWQVSVSESGNLYFGAGLRIFVSRFIGGEYTQPEPVTVINDIGEVACPFIAPDESYLIFYKGIGDLVFMYVSFKSQDGEWLPPRRMVEIPIGIGCSFVTRDGEYLFVNDHWISAEILDDYSTDVREGMIAAAPRSFDLLQNYPNPFNPSTTIAFELQRPSSVVLQVFSMDGVMIRSLVEKTHFVEGSYTVEWDGTDETGSSVSSGVYLYRLQSGVDVSSKRMLLLR